MSEVRTFNETILESQRTWREAKRGIISRPQELPVLSGWFDMQLKSVFSRYIDPNRVSAFLVWSVLADETPNNYSYRERFPGGLAELDQEPFSLGMYLLNEWATNFATGVFLRELSSNGLYRTVVPGYFRAFRFLNGDFLYSPTTQYMRTIENKAQARGDDFTDALLVALFQHDSDKLDFLINKAELNECEDLNELALKIGRNSKGDHGDPSFLNRLVTTKSDNGSKIELHKRLIVSLLGGGKVSRPGIAEVILAAPVELGLLTKLLAYSNVVSLASFAGLLSVYGFVTIHELIHANSADQGHNGLMRSDLVKA